MSRVAFATNDERTAKRLSRRPRHHDRTARDEELCRPPPVTLARASDGIAPGNGPRLAYARRDHAAAIRFDEIILVSGAAPIRAQKVRYFRDAQSDGENPKAAYRRRICTRQPYGIRRLEQSSADSATSGEAGTNKPADDTDGGIRREPEIPEHEDVAPEFAVPARGITAPSKTNPTTRGPPPTRPRHADPLPQRPRVKRPSIGRRHRNCEGDGHEESQDHRLCRRCPLR